jgi:DNA-directed RNA polymerase beta' subunit
MFSKKNDLENLIAEIFEETDMETAAVTSDLIKKIGFKYATRSGISIGQDDMIIPKKKEEILNDASEKVRLIGNQYWKGFITDHERYLNTIRIWSQAKSDITAEMVERFQGSPENDVYYMIDSSARGNWGRSLSSVESRGWWRIQEENHRASYSREFKRRIFDSGIFYCYTWRTKRKIGYGAQNRRSRVFDTSSC